jgi:hypothetical protein
MVKYNVFSMFENYSDMIIAQKRDIQVGMTRVDCLV